ncbi:ethanolamine ammonia-lyase small subunit [Caldalkalibacillus uzonensis]|uniref:Ethanolamine ammonia-lyase small subunit n=1 Tax=Caldalkalibacillus uzonensis TaxID=353224 RepID=A0ABU0CS78_9BACI|nr:ethanolamine ammonia-lyase subunit EutC [Caldalkalibacillus uzonensis]MDQ0338731.1 ethanolamine ammonia-lyase small subunit [Caldalkalibacillus uzonensis]
MDRETVTAITRLVLKKLEEMQATEKNSDTSPTVSTQSSQMVKIWDHLTEKPRVITHGAVHKQDDQLSFNSSISGQDELLKEPETRAGVDQPLYPEALSSIRSSTPARIGIGRAGPRPKTEAWLRFRLDHAAAVDAVHGEVIPDLLEKHALFTVQTLVKNKDEFIRRPDLGRKLSEEAKATIRERCMFQPQVQVIVSDGLSAEAILQNFEDTYLSLLQSLQQLGLKTGTPFYIERGRVAVMDDVGELLQPEVVVLLIGERPGLVSAESLSAYLCYRPRKGTVEADRMVISNIHRGGIPPVEAGAYLGNVVQKILKYKASGVSLVKKEK